MTSTVGPGRASDGRSLVLAAPRSLNVNLDAPELAKLQGQDVLDITYLLFGDGFAHETTVNKFQTTRYTLAQILENEGTVQDTITLRYPYLGTDADVLRTKFTQGSEWDIFERLVTPNETGLADGQLLSIAASVRCGLQREIPRTANTEIGKVQDLLVTGLVRRDVVIGGEGVTGWTLDVTGTPTGGDYTLFVNGVPTAPIAHNATHTAIASAINGIQGVTGVTVTSVAGPPIALTFSGKASLSVDDSNLSGGTSPAVVVAKA